MLLNLSRSHPFNFLRSHEPAAWIFGSANSNELDFGFSLEGSDLRTS